jgi:hypothetical protein
MAISKTINLIVFAKGKQIVFTVSVDKAAHSGTLANMLEDCPVLEDVPLNDISEKCMTKIHEFMLKHECVNPADEKEWAKWKVDNKEWIDTCFAFPEYKEEWEKDLAEFNEYVLKHKVPEEGWKYLRHWNFLNGVKSVEGANTCSYPKESWDRLFMEMKVRNLLFELLTAANFLDHKKLIDIVTDVIPEKMIKGKTHIEIRESMGIINDLTPAREEEIMREMGWISGDLTAERRQQIGEAMGWVKPAETPDVEMPQANQA